MELLSPGKYHSTPTFLESILTRGENKVWIFELLTKMFTLSEDEQIRAGICFGVKSRELIGRSALIIPSLYEKQDPIERSALVIPSIHDAHN